MLVVEAFLLPPAPRSTGPLTAPRLLLVTALGTVGYAAAGTLLAGVAANTRAQAVALRCSSCRWWCPSSWARCAHRWIAGGGHLSDVHIWMRLLVAYDLMVVAVATVTFGTCWRSNSRGTSH
jgi:hypothetical protein